MGWWVFERFSGSLFCLVLFCTQGHKVDLKYGVGKEDSLVKNFAVPVAVYFYDVNVHNLKISKQCIFQPRTLQKHNR